MKNLLLSALLLSVTASMSITASADPQLDSCIPRLQQRALAAGISTATVNQVMPRLQYVAKVIELDRRQPEFVETFHNYLTNRVTEDRVRAGRKMLAQYKPLLHKLLKEYGVPPQYLIAFWGMETHYGNYLGKMPVLDSLATLACDERRSEFFTLELLEALKMVDTGTVTPEAFLGSWAGAVGNMQFMPSAYRRYALDADGDGRADLWRSIPDALTSAAHYLNQLGWERELRWGREVILPKNFDYSQATLSQQRNLKEWRAMGIKMANGAPLPNYSIQASILVPAGHTGPAFIVYDNFNVIMKWNRSQYYGIAVGHLADRINGASELHQPPPDQARLTKPEIEALQTALNTAGFDAGEPDGVLGSGTRNAVRAFQQAKGMIADGYPAADVFQALGVAVPK